MDVEERIKRTIEHKKLSYHDLAMRSGIAAQRWNNSLNKRTKIRWEEIDAICKIFPEYEYWITREKTAPEIGQISPETEKITDDYRKQG